MQEPNDAVVSRDDLVAAVRRIINKGRGEPRGRIAFRPSETSAGIEVSSDFGAAVVIASEGIWTGHISVAAATLVALLRAKMPARLQLNFARERLNVGPTAVPACDETPGPPPAASAPASLEPKETRQRGQKSRPAPKRPIMPDRW